VSREGRRGERKRGKRGSREKGEGEGEGRGKPWEEGRKTEKEEKILLLDLHGAIRIQKY
jgi:hypothetical protein